MLLMLWSLFLRPVSFECRHKINKKCGNNFWDWMLCVGSFITVFIIGITIGNLFLGLPFQFDLNTLHFYYARININIELPPL